MSIKKCNNLVGMCGKLRLHGVAPNVGISIASGRRTTKASGPLMQHVEAYHCFHAFPVTIMRVDILLLSWEEKHPCIHCSSQNLVPGCPESNPPCSGVTFFAAPPAIRPAISWCGSNHLVPCMHGRRCWLLNCRLSMGEMLVGRLI